MKTPSREAAAGERRERLFWGAFHIFILAFAVWLVSPFIVISASGVSSRQGYGLRLALGLLIFLMYVGKWSFDVLAPQGLARRVSRLKTAALIAYIVIVISFMIYVVAQAASLYLRTAVDEPAGYPDQLITRLERVENPAFGPSAFFP